MILVDTSIIIDFWQSPSERIKTVFQTQATCICGVTRAELLHGARTQEDAQRITRALDAMQTLPIGPATWDDLGHNLFLLRTAA